jgi:hypothetical protein
MRILDSKRSEIDQIIPLARGPSPRLFIGSEEVIGIVPFGARAGDTIVQFWNSSASAIVRPGMLGEYQIIGRAGMVRDGDSLDWDVPMDRDMFQNDRRSYLDLSLGIIELTKLSLDTVDLLGELG